MKKVYVIYNKTTPFAGYIEGAGRVRTDMPPDGSTMMERLQALPAEKGYFLFDKSTEMPDRESVKFDEATESLVSLEAGDVTPEKQDEQDEIDKAQAFIDNLPDWTTTKSAIDTNFTEPGQNTIITKMAKALYWLARGRPE